MARYTISEALAEIRTLTKRIEKKREFIEGNLARQNFMRDPMEREGGVVSVVAQERQSLADLLQRKVEIRRAIRVANETTMVLIQGKTRSIGDWLTWRREVAPQLKEHLTRMTGLLMDIRKKATQSGLRVGETGAGDPQDVIVHVNERELAAEREQLETILGELDGQLSLQNATILMEL